MSDPNWKALSEVTWTADILPVLDALGVVDAEIPKNGRPRRFLAMGCTASIGEDGVFMVCNNVTSKRLGTGDEVLEFLDLRKGYASDKALRRWLRLWGWTPPSKAPAAEPAPPPMVV